MARQEFSVGAALKMMMNLLTDLLGGEVPMAEGGPGVDADQPCDLGDLQSDAAMEQEMAGDSRSRVIPWLLLEKLKHGVEDASLLIGQPLGRHIRLAQPLFERRTFPGHSNTPMTAVSLVSEPQSWTLQS
jgi:hypothetical protein